MTLFAPNLDGPLAKSTAGFRSAEPTKTPDGKYAVDVYIAGVGVSLAINDPN
jgi:hypothetical protein